VDKTSARAVSLSRRCFRLNQGHIFNGTVEQASRQMGSTGTDMWAYETKHTTSGKIIRYNIRTREEHLPPQPFLFDLYFDETPKTRPTKTPRHQILLFLFSVLQFDLSVCSRVSLVTIFFTSCKRDFRNPR
jgi:hypothetical protein